MLARPQAWAKELRAQVLTLGFCRSHPATPWYAKALAALVVAYAFSPIDLIPDFIPVLGYLDDLILVPLGIYLTLRLIPPQVVAEGRQRADAWIAAQGDRPTNYVPAAVIIAISTPFAYWLCPLCREPSLPSATFS